MDRFFEKLERKIRKAVKSDMKKISKEIGTEKVYAVAMITDNDCVTLSLALNTHEYLRKADEVYIERHQNLTEADIKRVRDGSLCLTKWMLDKWGYSDGKNSNLSKINKLLYKTAKSKSEEYENNKTLFLGMVTSAFKHLIEENTFGNATDEITYFIFMADDDDNIALANYSAKLLNSQESYESFLKRVEVK